MSCVDAASKVLPVLLLFGLGAAVRGGHFVTPQTIQDLKQLVVNVTLPAVLFLAFSGVNLERPHLLIVAIVFGGGVLALALGLAFKPFVRQHSIYFPAPMTGFEAGMIGYAIFSTVYGSKNVLKFAIVDLGQVTFVFFILVTWLEHQDSGARPLTDTLLGYVKSSRHHRHLSGHRSQGVHCT